LLAIGGIIERKSRYAQLSYIIIFDKLLSRHKLRLLFQAWKRLFQYRLTYFWTVAVSLGFRSFEAFCGTDTAIVVTSIRVIINQWRWFISQLL